MQPHSLESDVLVADERSITTPVAQSSAAAAAAAVLDPSSSPAAAATQMCVRITPSFHLLQQPSSLILKIANDYLIDTDARSFGHTCWHAVTLTHTYTIKNVLPLSVAIRSTTAITSLAAAVGAAAAAATAAAPTSGLEEDDTHDTPTSSSNSSASSSAAAAGAATSTIVRKRRMFIGTPVTVSAAVRAVADHDSAAASPSASLPADAHAESVSSLSYALSRLPSIRTLSVTLQPTPSIQLDLSLLHLNDSITSLHIVGECDEGGKYDYTLRSLRLPICLQSLYLHYKTNHPVSELPQWQHCQHLHTLGLNGDFNQPVDSLQLPPSLTRLLLSYAFNQPIDRLQLPQSLLEFCLNGDFNQDISAVRFPPSMTSLELSSSFNQDVSSLQLPPQLRILKFNGMFNHSLDRLSFPATLTSLALGQTFDQPLSEWHPPQSLTHLRLPHDWKRPWSQLKIHTLPIHTLTLPFHNYHPLSEFHMPPTLTSLTVNYGCLSATAGAAPIKWPSQLTEISLTSDSNVGAIRLCELQFPPSLLRLNARANKVTLKEWTAPSLLEVLEAEIGSECYFDFTALSGVKLSSSLHTLILHNGTIRHLIDAHLPASLTSLTLGWGGIGLPPHDCPLCGDSVVPATLSLQQLLELESQPSSVSTSHPSTVTAATSASAPLASSSSPVASASLPASVPVCRLAHLLPPSLRILRFQHAAAWLSANKYQQPYVSKLREAISRGDSAASATQRSSITMPTLLPAPLLLPEQLEKLVIEEVCDIHSYRDTRQLLSVNVDGSHCQVGTLTVQTRVCKIPLFLQPLPSSLRLLHLAKIDLALVHMPILPPSLRLLRIPLYAQWTHTQPMVDAANEWIEKASAAGKLPPRCAVIDSNFYVQE